MQTAVRTVLITGASRGIGAALALRLARRERIVFLNHRDSAQAAHEVQASAQGDVRVVQADVTDGESVARMARIVSEAGDRLDVLVHNACAPLIPRRVARLDWERDVQPQIDVACRGFLNCVHAFEPFLRPGSLVYVMLTEALFHRPPVRFGAYLAAKGALWGLTRALAKEYQSQRITVLMISPGTTATELHRNYDPRALEIMADELPLRRLAAPDEIAATIAALIDHGTEYLHGTNLVMNGGTDF